MKLYECPQRCYVHIIDEDVRIPPDALVMKKDDVVFFDHVDGMYSYCKDQAGNVVHIAAWTEVDVISTEEAKAAWDIKD